MTSTTLSLKHPFTCLAAGPTSSGKTTWVKKLLTQAKIMIDPPPQHVVWCYGAWQAEYEDMKSSVDEWVEGLPDLESYDPSTRHLVVIDDLMAETDQRVTNFFTKGSHHRNTSVIYLVQNLFHKGKEHRTISLNSHYLVMFKNPRDGSQINHLAKQMYPGRTKFLQEAFADATSRPYGYLLIDLKQSTVENVRVRTNIFPDEVTFAYLQRA